MSVKPELHRMKFEQPNVVMLRWREDVRRHGSIISRQAPVEIHHVVGRTAKQKIDGITTNIGHAFVLPVTTEEHKQIHQGDMQALIDSYRANNFMLVMDDLEKLSLRQFQQFLFERLVQVVRPPFGDDIIEAILQ